MKNILSKTTLADRLLLALLTILSVSGIFAVREAMPQSADVVVEIEGKVVFTAPLSNDRVFTLDSASGPVEIEIRNRMVRIRDAHCPNRLCVKEGWVSKGAIVCLPNRLVVFVGKRGSPDKGLDAVTG